MRPFKIHAKCCCEGAARNNISKVVICQKDSEKYKLSLLKGNAYDNIMRGFQMDAGKRL
jgi:hypothetical protein